MENKTTKSNMTLGDYRKIAPMFGQQAIHFIEEKIKQSPNGENEMVIADERQMMLLFVQLGQPTTTPPAITDN